MTDRRTILVTGCTRGLGRALVAEFAARGHVALGCGRSESAVATLRAAFSPPHDFAVVDVADHKAVDAWAARLEAEHRSIDLLINNAALMNVPAPLWAVPAAEFGRLMEVNVGGTVNVIRSFVPGMIAAGRGVIANLSSGWGRSVSPEVAPYCASKFAVEGLTRALAQELPRPLAAVAVNPGIIDTDMLRQAWAADAGAYPAADEWAPGAADFFLTLGPKDNGKSLNIPA
ncbi:MAG: SDR family oxidoreductase [bacterium]